MTGPETSPESARLSAGLRELKDRTGLSLVGLAAKTTFSKSSWDRYLKGGTLPPRPAIEELCRLAGEPEGRYLALRELAQSEWNDTRQKPAPAPVPPLSAPAPCGSTAVGHRGATVVAVLVSVSALVFGAVVLTLLLLPDRSGTAWPPTSPSATGPGCGGRACEGRDPVAMQCGPEPETLAEHVTATGASMQLRYSKGCGATWVRMWGTRIGDRVELRGRVARVANRAEADTYVHTPMTATRPGTVVRACFLPTKGARKECFRARVD
ncbi:MULTISPECIES: helix-turn-helix domain-containing protein [Streptomyces]|uniref:Helix-turn-helix domain-containing protein n=2 Tax=Streptomyces TaxID=1883 RepID=A0ABV9J041_9ACTN